MGLLNLAKTEITKLKIAGSCYTCLTFHFTVSFFIGAKIRIDRDSDDMSSPLRKCTITGTSDQIANAKGLLDEKIAEDNEIRARRGDIGMSRNRRAPRKLDSALGKFCINSIHAFK